MFKLVIPAQELFDENTNEFIEAGETVVLELEHSLVSMSKWEAKYQKPFLVSDRKSSEEIFEYIKAMVITPNPDLEALDRCSQKNIADIQKYLDSSQSATTFGIMPEPRGQGETITSELIYFWMIEFNVPFECQYWHLNRLFSLLRICNIKKGPKQKMPRRELAERNQRLNAERRAKLGTSG